MDNKLTKKFGLLTAICMVVGIVIGSGIFFKAGKVLTNVGGNIGKALLVVGLVGLIMIICSLVFAILGTKFERVNGIVDYAEATLGPRYAYYVGWFMTTMYYPIITSTLAWISVMYASTLFSVTLPAWLHFLLAIGVLVISFLVNTLSPKIAGYFQVSTTFIKLVPLILVAIVGTIAGLCNGLTLDAFKTVIEGTTAGGVKVNDNIFIGVSAFAFAYEGWIIATAINAEIKNGKRNLPIALVLGSIIVIAVYMLYFIGMTGAISTENMIDSGDSLPKKVFTALFKSKAMGTIIMVFVVLSCLGTVNGLVCGCTRGMYSLAVRDEGPSPVLFSKINEKTNMPVYSAIFGFIVCVIWLAQWQFIFFGKILPAFWCWEGDEVSIITLYAFYIPMFIGMMVKCKDLHPIKRFVLPGLASICCLFMCYCAYDAYKANNQIFSYLLVFAIIMIIGFFFSNDFTALKNLFKRKNTTEE